MLQRRTFIRTSRLPVWEMPHLKHATKVEAEKPDEPPSLNRFAPARLPLRPGKPLPAPMTTDELRCKILYGSL